LTGEYGLAIDNLEQVSFERDNLGPFVCSSKSLKVTIILPNRATPTIASATSHSDLFWALRGAGSNFGVVTEFVFRLYPQRKTIFSGFLIYPLLSDPSAGDNHDHSEKLKLEKLDQVFGATSEWWCRNGGVAGGVPQQESVFVVVQGDNMKAPDGGESASRLDQVSRFHQL